MTLECLTDTKCGRIVNRMINDPEFGDRASDLVLKWRKVADAESSVNKQKVIEQERRELSIKSEPIHEEDVK